MADEFQLGSGNWWDTPRNTNFETQATAISTTLNTIASYGWPMEMATAAAADVKSRSSIDSGAGAVMIRHGQSSGVVGQIMGLGLSDWNQNQAFVRGDKAESSFRPLIHEDFGPNTVDFQQAESRRTTPYQELWRQQNQGFALDQTQFSSNDSTMTSQNLAADAAGYGLLPSENHHQPYQNRQMNYPYPSNEYNNYPPFLRTSSPKHTPMAAAAAGVGSHLHFSNNTPFWNASAMAEARPAFFPDIQKQIPAPPSFDEKAKSLSEIREVGSTMKKTTVESSNKRPRSDSTSPLPAFKVRKEKMGDRITALQQLVSPFGKTDTASVLSEAIEYIKYLHEQVTVLSAPYMKHAAPTQHHQTMDRSKDEEGTYQDLRSRGLCLVPVTSTFPVTHESTVDFWTPTFGGTFR